MNSVAASNLVFLNTYGDCPVQVLKQCLARHIAVYVSFENELVLYGPDTVKSLKANNLPVSYADSDDFDLDYKDYITGDFTTHNGFTQLDRVAIRRFCKEFDVKVHGAEVGHAEGWSFKDTAGYWYELVKSRTISAAQLYCENDDLITITNHLSNAEHSSADICASPQPSMPIKRGIDWPKSFDLSNNLRCKVLDATHTELYDKHPKYSDWSKEIVVCVAVNQARKTIDELKQEFANTNTREGAVNQSTNTDLARHLARCERPPDPLRKKDIEKLLWAVIGKVYIENIARMLSHGGTNKDRPERLGYLTSIAKNYDKPIGTSVKVHVDSKLQTITGKPKVVDLDVNGIAKLLDPSATKPDKQCKPPEEHNLYKKKP